MKKSLVIVSVFLVIAIICSTFITIAVGAKTDEVVFTEDRLTGDISEISGITAVCHTTYDDLLFWDSSCTFEDEIKTETEFKAYQTKNWDTYHADPEGVHMDSNIYSDRFYDYIHTEDPDYELAGIGVAMMELYEECAPGEEVKKVIDLQDYCEYYPINFTIDMPNYIVGWNSDIIIDDWVLFNDNEAALIDNFMEYFL